MVDSKTNALDLVSTLDPANPRQSIVDLRDAVDCLSLGEIIDLYNTFGALTAYLETRLGLAAITGEYAEFKSTLH